MSSRHPSTASPDAAITLNRKTFNELVLQTSTMADAVAAGKARVSGNAERFDELMAMMDNFERMFEIVEPRTRREQA